MYVWGPHGDYLGTSVMMGTFSRQAFQTGIEKEKDPITKVTIIKKNKTHRWREPNHRAWLVIQKVMHTGRGVLVETLLGDDFQKMNMETLNNEDVKGKMKCWMSEGGLMYGVCTGDTPTFVISKNALKYLELGGEAMWTLKC